MCHLAHGLALTSACRLYSLLQPSVLEAHRHAQLHSPIPHSPLFSRSPVRSPRPPPHPAPPRRDVVDGMGVTGTEGAFRRACDAAMRVLRSDAPSVLTILEVLLHDPLYRWMLSPLAARQRQQEEEKAGSGDSGGGGRGSAAAAAAAAAAAEDDDTGVGGDAAQRALARIKHKLQGYVDPNGDAMSVEGQVKLLINQARDPENLCKLYPGWAPWL